jgi:hypothetical protein
VVSVGTGLYYVKMITHLMDCYFAHSI